MCPQKIRHPYDFDAIPTLFYVIPAKAGMTARDGAVRRIGNAQGRRERSWSSKGGAIEPGT